MHPEINRSPNGDRVGFLFTWRHRDGSLVTFCPDGWASSDPDKTAWLKAMNGLVSSAPTIPPGVRVWLEKECQLVEFREPYHESHLIPAPTYCWHGAAMECLTLAIICPTIHSGSIARANKECHRSKLNQPRIIEIIQPANST